jgi:hypothetical protein
MASIPLDTRIPAGRCPRHTPATVRPTPIFARRPGQDNYAGQTGGGCSHVAAFVTRSSPSQLRIGLRLTAGRCRHVYTRARRSRVPSAGSPIKRCAGRHVRLPLRSRKRSKNGRLAGAAFFSGGRGSRDELPSPVGTCWRAKYRRRWALISYMSGRMSLARLLFAPERAFFLHA